MRETDDRAAPGGSSRVELKVAFLAVEAAPFAKVGGLGDVAGALPAALVRQGVAVTQLLPRYGQIDFTALDATLIASGIQISVGPETHEFAVWRVERDGVQVLLLDAPTLFGEAQVYIDLRDRVRFTAFCRAVPAALAAAGFAANVLHANDWHSALAVLEADPALARVLTIHNLAHQGITDIDYAETLGIAVGELLDGEREQFPGKINLLARAIAAAEQVTTVSPRYAREVLTAEFGAGLEAVLQQRTADLTGILNGIDTEHFNPATDPDLAATYTADDLEAKAANKAALQRELGLPMDADRPLLGMVSRLDGQKGFDLVTSVVPALVERGVQVAVLGTGLPEYHALAQALVARYPEQVSVTLAFDATKAQHIYGGADMFLMPSRFEPCGLGQMVAMRYGTVPVVRETGGLADTVHELGVDANGFTFVEYAPEALLAAIDRALATWGEPGRQRWQALQRNGMRADLTWDGAARQYRDVYERALAQRPQSSVAAVAEQRA